MRSFDSRNFLLGPHDGIAETAAHSLCGMLAGCFSTFPQNSSLSASKIVGSYEGGCIGADRLKPMKQSRSL
jgi:hypothetical protein